MSTRPEANLDELKTLYAELHRELLRQVLLEEALARAREGVNWGHEERAAALAPYALAYDPHAEAYLEEVLGRHEPLD